MTSSIQATIFNSAGINWPLWESEYVDLSKTKPGASAPSFEKFADDGAGSEGIDAYLFSNAQDQSLHFAFSLRNTWAADGIIYPVLFFKTGNTTGNIVWELECIAANPLGLPSDTSTVKNVSYDAQTPLELEQVVFPAITIPDPGIPSGLAGRIARNGSDVLDTFEDGVFAFVLQFFYKKDSAGSHGMTTK